MKRLTFLKTAAASVAASLGLTRFARAGLQTKTEPVLSNAQDDLWRDHRYELPPMYQPVAIRFHDWLALPRVTAARRILLPAKPGWAWQWLGQTPGDPLITADRSAEWRSLEPIKTQPGGWILMEDAMPPIGMDVMITCESDYGPYVKRFLTEGRRTMLHKDYPRADGQLWYWSGPWLSENKLVAWMPKPLPFGQAFPGIVYHQHTTADWNWVPDLIET